MQVEEFKGFHQGEGWFLTWIDGVEVVFMDERLTPGSLSAYLDLIEELMRTATTARSCLYQVLAPSAFDARARSRLAGLFNKYKAGISKNTLGFALVTPSAPVRGILTALHWISPPPYPDKVFSDLPSAGRWLVQWQPGLQPDVLLTRFELLKARHLAKRGAV